MRTSGYIVCYGESVIRLSGYMARRFMNHYFFMFANSSILQDPIDQARPLEGKIQAGDMKGIGITGKYGAKASIILLTSRIMDALSQNSVGRHPQP